jgi:hypothetical protein
VIRESARHGRATDPRYQFQCRPREDEARLRGSARESSARGGSQVGAVLQVPARGAGDQTTARGTLIVQLDRNGHVLHSSKTSNVYTTYLFAQGSGFSLLEHLRHKLDVRKLGELI